MIVNVNEVLALDKKVKNIGLVNSNGIRRFILRLSLQTPLFLYSTTFLLFGIKALLRN